MSGEWSDKVLEETPARATKFLSGVGAEPVVRTLLEGAGMTDADIVEGRALLMDCLAAPGAPQTATDTESARQQRLAVAELDAWDEPNFARYRAALARHFPAVSEVVFHDLATATGAESVRGVATFLLRVDELERAGQRDAASAGATAFSEIPTAGRRGALELLAKRGLDRKTRDHLAALTRTALGPTETLAEAPASHATARAKRRDAQRALRSWYDDWSATARSVVKKRAYLIRLGLAERKAPKPSAARPAPAPQDPAAPR